MANKKITELTELTTPAGADIVAIVDDVAGTPITKKVTVTNLMTQAPVQTADIANFSSAFYSTVSETTTARTLSDSDNGKIIVCDNTALVTVTVPTGLTSGFSCKIIQGGAGKVKVVGASGVTLSLIGGYNTTTVQYAVVDLVNYASETYVLDSSNIGLDPSAWSGNTISTSYDGSNDYVIASSSMSFTGVFSVSFWLRKGTSQSSGDGLLFGSGSVGAGPYAYSRFTSGGGDFLIRGGPSVTITGAVVANSTWTHFMITRNSSNLISVYKNGSSIGSATWSGTYNFDRFIGGFTGIGYFEALFDEVAVWDSDQSANASNIYNSGSPDNLSTYAPLHWWRMGDSDSPSDGDTTPTTIPDIGSDGSNSLTLTNGPTYSTTVP